MLAGLIGWTLAWSGRRTPAFHATTWYNTKNWPYRRRKREIKWDVNSKEERRMKEKDNREGGDRKGEGKRGSEIKKKNEKLRKMEVRVKERGRKREKEKCRRNEDSRGRRRKAKLETAVRGVICIYSLPPLLQLLFLRSIHSVSSFAHIPSFSFLLLLLFSSRSFFLFSLSSPLPPFLRFFSFLWLFLHVLHSMMRSRIFLLEVSK